MSTLRLRAVLEDERVEMNAELVSRTAAEWITLIEGEAGSSKAAAETEFASLVKCHSRFLFRVAYAVLRNVEDAEDVVQDAFYKLLRSGAWKRMEDEQAFLARVVWRLAVDRRPSRRPNLSPEAETLASGERDAESAAIVNERSRTIHRVIDSLPEKLRRPLSLSCLEEMTMSRIAVVMNLPEGTVRRLITEARALVREKLARMEGGRNG